jgi:hypothetical protein
VSRRPALVAGAFIGLAVLMGLLTIAGLRGAVGGDSGAPDLDAPSAASRGDGPAPTRAPAATATGAPVVLTPSDDDRFPTKYPVIDELAPGDVLTIRVTGFDEFEVAEARQCVVVDAAQCGNVFPVQFGEGGVARFQYSVTDAFLPGSEVSGGCRDGAAPCLVVVESEDGDAEAHLFTVFHNRAAPPGRVDVAPSRDLEPGDAVTVSVTGFPPRARVFAMLCAAPEDLGRARCGAPGPSAELGVGPDGTGQTRLVIDDGPVGRAGARCGRGETCGVNVSGPEVFARAPVVPVDFAAPPGAAYERTRVLLGLAAAVILLAVAAAMLRRTDWSAVGEEAAPELDDAEYADLDAIVAALPPDDDGVDSHEDMQSAR